MKAKRPERCECERKCSMRRLKNRPTLMWKTPGRISAVQTFFAHSANLLDRRERPSVLRQQDLDHWGLGVRGPASARRLIKAGMRAKKV
jgi:hypothetical protein